VAAVVVAVDVVAVVAAVEVVVTAGEVSVVAVVAVVVVTAVPVPVVPASNTQTAVSLMAINILPLTSGLTYLSNEVLTLIGDIYIASA